MGNMHSPRLVAPDFLILIYSIIRLQMLAKITEGFKYLTLGLGEKLVSAVILDFDRARMTYDRKSAGY